MPGAARMRRPLVLLALAMLGAPDVSVAAAPPDLVRAQLDLRLEPATREL